MEDKILGFAYRYSKKEYNVETYAVMYEDDCFIYRQLKKYDKVFGNLLIKELESLGFKNMSYWNNIIIEINRDNINSVKKSV